MSAVTGTGRLVLLQVRTMPLALLATLLVIAGTTAAVASGIAELYDSPDQRLVYAATLGSSPMTAAINGRGYDLDLLGGIAMYEIGFFGLLLLPAMVLLLAIRSTRGQEDLGRGDLITAMRVGRLAPLAAGITVLTITIAAACALMWLAMVALGYEPAGTARYCSALALFLVGIGGLGFCCAEIGQSARTAYSLAFGGLLAVYLLRAVIDGNSWDAEWVTTMGWLAAARPYSAQPPVWPYLALGAAAIASPAVALVLRARRDLGAGLIAPRPGRANGTLKTPGALIGYLTRSPTLAWGAAAVVWGAAMGLLAEEMRTLVETNPLLAQALAGETDSPEYILSYITVALVALLASAFGLQAVGRLAAEETAGRLGVVFSTTVGRARFWIRAVAVLTGQALLVLAAGALSYGLVAVAMGAQWSVARTAFEAGAGYAAPVLLTLGLALVSYAASARWVTIGWLVPLWASVVLLLGETLQLPTWARNLSPLEWSGMLPIESVDTATTVVLLVLGAAAVAVAVPRLVSRDLAAG